MLDQIIQDLESLGISFVEDFFSHEELRAIGEEFVNLHPEFHAARVGASGQEQRVETVRGDYTYWLDPQETSEVFRPVMTFLNQLKTNLNSTFFMGLKDYECHLAYYPPGTFYQKHLDRFETSSTRSLSFIFYLHESWTSEDGGELVIYNEDGAIVKTITPKPGSFVCFLSHKFPHEVKSGKRERRSLTGWMHTKIIY